MWEFNTQGKKEEDYSSISKKEINAIKNQIRLLDQPCTLLTTKLLTKLDDLTQRISSNIQSESDANIAAKLSSYECVKAGPLKKKPKQKKKGKHEDIDDILSLLDPEFKSSFSDRLHHSMGTMKQIMFKGENCK